MVLDRKKEKEMQKSVRIVVTGTSQCGYQKKRFGQVKRKDDAD